MTSPDRSPLGFYIESPLGVRGQAGIQIVDVSDAPTWEIFYDRFYIRESHRVADGGAPTGFVLNYIQSYYLEAAFKYDQFTNRYLDNFRIAGPGVGDLASGTGRIGFSTEDPVTNGSGVGGTIDGTWLESQTIGPFDAGTPAPTTYPHPVVPEIDGTVLSSGYPRSAGQSPLMYNSTVGDVIINVLAGTQIKSVYAAQALDFGFGPDLQRRVLAAGAVFDKLVTVDSQYRLWFSFKVRAL